MSPSFIPCPCLEKPTRVSVSVFGTCSQPCTVCRSQQGLGHILSLPWEEDYGNVGGSGGREADPEAPTACDRCPRATLQLLTFLGVSLVLI